MKIQIDEKLFIDLVKWHLLDFGDEEAAARISKGLQDKLDAIVLRNLYTKSKTAPSAEERERARQDYLDRRGVPDISRWSEGCNPHKPRNND